MRFKCALGLIVLMLLSGCKAGNIMSRVSQGDGLQPSNTEIVSGLKEALSIGAERGAKSLSQTDGYYKSVYKILLPPEADSIINNIAKIPGGQQKVDDVVLRINRAAESAAEKAAPIFVDAISGMTVQDGMDILTGGDDAATQYLRKTTRAKLVDAYRPTVQSALSEPVIAGISAQSSWNTLAGSYNAVAGSTVGKIAGMQNVQSDLGEYVLDKSVDAMFLQIANEEKEIRANPLGYSSSLIKKVFGYAKGAQ